MILRIAEVENKGFHIFPKGINSRARPFNVGLDRRCEWGKWRKWCNGVNGVNGANGENGANGANGAMVLMAKWCEWY